MSPHDFRRLALAHELLSRAVPSSQASLREDLPRELASWPSSPARPDMAAARSAEEPCEQAGPAPGLEAAAQVRFVTALSLM